MLDVNDMRLQGVMGRQPPQAPDMQGSGALQSASMAAPAPSPAGNNIGNTLGGLLMPKRAGRNRTVEWLQSQGMDAGTATLVAGDKGLLRQHLMDRTRGADPMDALKLQKTQLEIEKLRNPTTDDIKEYELAKREGYQGNFNQYMTSLKQAGATSINNITKGETEFDKAMGKNLAETTINIVDAGRAAPNKIATLQAMGDALASTYTGAGGESVLKLRQAAQSLGMDVGDDIGDAEFARAAANRIALELRNPAGGAGMPGAMSDKDREFLVSSVPGLTKTPEGNRRLIEYMIAIEQRNVEVAQRANEYMRRNSGRLDQFFFEGLAKWSAENPLFKEASGESSNGKRVINGYTIEQVD
ncbi:MAG: hypothetical protein ACPG4X_19645 [Pikeienuella sp.]